jgi:hypothetical protein
MYSADIKRYGALCCADAEIRGAQTGRGIPHIWHTKKQFEQYNMSLLLFTSWMQF